MCLLEIEKRKSASLAASNASRSASKHSLTGSRMSTSKTQLPTSDSLDSFNAIVCGMKRELSKDTVDFSLQPSNEYLESHQPHVNGLVKSLSRIYTEDEDEDYIGRPLPEVVQEQGRHNKFVMEQIDSNDCNISIASSVTDYGELFPDKEAPLPDGNSCENNFTDDEVAAGWHMHSIDRDPDYHGFNQVMHRPKKANERILASNESPPQPDKVSEKRSTTKSSSSRKSSSKKSSESLSTRKSKSSRKSSSKKSSSKKSLSSKKSPDDPSVPSEKPASEKKVSSEKIPSQKIPSEKISSEKVASVKVSSEKVSTAPEVKSEPPAEPAQPPTVAEPPPTAPEEGPTGKKAKDGKKKGGKGGCFMDAAKQQGCGNPFFNPYMFGCNPMKYIDVKECDKSGNVVMMIKKPKNKMMYYYDSSADEGGCGGGAPGPSQGQGGPKLPDINQNKRKTTKASASNYQMKFPNPSSMGQMPPMMNPMMNPMANPYMSAMANPYMSAMSNPYMMQGAMSNMQQMQGMQNMMAQHAARQSTSRRNRKELDAGNA